MTLKARLLAATLPVLALAYGAPAYAQVACSSTDADGNLTGGIDTATTTQLQTATANNGTACDVRVQTAGSVAITSGSAVILNSANDVTVDGNITSEDANNTTGIEVQGGNSGDVTLNGSIRLTETYVAADNDGDNDPDGAFAEGTGRTGILISGASPFTGSIRANQSSTIEIEGNDSYGFRLLQSAGLTGDVDLAGSMILTGTNVRGISVEGNMTGDLNAGGAISVRGEGGSAIVTEGDITGGITNTSVINNSGYRYLPSSFGVSSERGRSTVDPDDQLQAASAISIGGNVTEGVYLQSAATSSVATSRITQYGSAPAILFDGNGTQITIGLVTEVVDGTTNTLDFAFINQGIVTAQPTYNDISGTAVQVSDATLTGGISNTGTLESYAFRSGNDGTVLAADATGTARVVVLGSGAIVDAINNAGVIQAFAVEDTTVFSDPNNVVPARSLSAIAIDVEGNGTLTSIVNSGNITASMVGRDGTTIAIRDASGSITTIDNTGTIQALGVSPTLNTDPTNFTTIAMDLSVNTAGVAINQSLAVDPDPNDSVTPQAPAIVGDILLGSGADTLTASAGTITGDVAFGAGADSFALSGGTVYTGTLSDSDGVLDISVTGGSTLAQATASTINATTASFDGTSTFSPTIDGQAGTSSTLATTGDITFAEGASIAPLLASTIDPANNTFTLVDAGGTLSYGADLESLLAFTSPFLYNTSLTLDPNDPNALLITFDIRSAEAMGLDAVQAASFETAYGALSSNDDLARAFVNITDGTEFRGALNQLLPEFAAAARQFVVANVDGAVGAVGTHLDNARRSQDKPGGAWIQEFTYFADRDLAGLSEQYRGFGFGFTGGLDTAFGPFHTAGINFGFASTEIEDVVGFDDPLDVLTLQGGLYGGMQSGDFSLDVYGGGGFSDFEQTRRIQIGDYNETSDGDWSGTHLNGTIRGGYDIAVSEKFWIRPAFSLDYLRLNEKGYTENGPEGIALDVSSRKSELAGATAMINLGAKFEGRRTWIRPALRFGYRNEFINDGIVTNYGFAGLTQRASLQSQAFPKDGFLLGFTLAAGTPYSSVGLDFDSDIRDGFIRHTGRIVLRMVF